MQRFKTLMLREWMQHRTGWLVVMGVPFVVASLVIVFGSVDVDATEAIGKLQTAGPMIVATVATLGIAAATLALAWAASLIQAPGLARRDVQDRSIEFWLSLPASHVQSLGATLLMHLLVVPWLALAAGLAGGVLVALLALAKGFGIGAWAAVSWPLLLQIVSAVLARLVLGVALATLWLAPLILLTMAASAWFKRWGVPLVAGVLVGGGVVLENGYGNTIVSDTMRLLADNAGRALFAFDRPPEAGGLQVETPEQFDQALQMLPAWVLADAGHAVAALAQPAFALALLGGAAGFGLLWWRRQRGA